MGTLVFILRSYEQEFPFVLTLTGTLHFSDWRIKLLPPSYLEHLSGFHPPHVTALRYDEQAPWTFPSLHSEVAAWGNNQAQW
jgi:hypothetical protein